MVGRNANRGTGVCVWLVLPRRAAPRRPHDRVTTGATASCGEEMLTSGTRKDEGNG